MLPIYFVLYTAEFLSKLPFSAVYTSNVYAVAWLVGAYALAAIFLFQRKKQPKLVLLAVIFTFLLSQLYSWVEPLHDDFRVTVLDVGQGQSILLQSEGKAFLVDCGGDDSEDAADTTAEALLSQGICRLDGIVVTHFDKDHVGACPDRRGADRAGRAQFRIPADLRGCYSRGRQIQLDFLDAHHDVSDGAL